MCPGLFVLDLQLKTILSRLCTLLSKCQHLFEAKVYTDHQLTMYLGKMFYALFLTSENNQQNIMAIAPEVDKDLNHINEKHDDNGCNI